MAVPHRGRLCTDTGSQQVNSVSSGEQTPLLDCSFVLCSRLLSGDQGLDGFPGILFKVVLPNNALLGGAGVSFSFPLRPPVTLTIKPPLGKGPETCLFRWSVNCTLYCFLLPGLFLLHD